MNKDPKFVYQDKPLGVAIINIFDLPPFQLPPVCKTKDGTYEISLEIYGIEIQIEEYTWDNAIKLYERHIEACQKTAAFQRLFYDKNGTLKPRKR